MGNVSVGPSTALGGLAALAQAVPAYFQGREFAENEQDRRQKQAAAVMPFLVQRLKANPADPDAIKSLGQVYSTLGLGSVPTEPGQTPAASIAPTAPINTQSPQSLAKSLESPATENVPTGVPQIRTPGPDEVNLAAIGGAPTAQDFIAQHLQELTQLPPADRNAQSIAAYLRAGGVQPTDQDIQEVLGLPHIPDVAAQEKFLSTLSTGLSSAAKLGPGAVRSFLQVNQPIADQLGIGDLSGYITSGMLDDVKQSYNANLDKLTSAGLLSKVRADELLKHSAEISAKNLAQTNEANARAWAIPQQVANANARLALAIERENRVSANEARNLSTLPNSPKGRAMATAVLTQLRDDKRSAEETLKSVQKQLDPYGVGIVMNADSPRVKQLQQQSEQLKSIIDHRGKTINALESELFAGTGLNLPGYVKVVGGKKPKVTPEKTVPESYVTQAMQKHGWSRAQVIQALKAQGYQVAQ